MYSNQANAESREKATFSLVFAPPTLHPPFPCLAALFENYCVFVLTCLGIPEGLIQVTHSGQTNNGRYLKILSNEQKICSLLGQKTTAEILENATQHLKNLTNFTQYLSENRRRQNISNPFYEARITLSPKAKTVQKKNKQTTIQCLFRT